MLAALAYIPLLLTKPGMVASDTKQYLYLDPGRFVRQVASLWDPQFAGGMVTHQYIGYLLPQGPFYWACASLHVPVWIAQRLWMGTLLFLAGAGARYLLRLLGMGGPGPLFAGGVYMLSPYAMQYIERISAILMPWAGLAWMVGFTALAVRRGGWRYPAGFALVVALAGGTNATSILYVCLAPLAWLAYAWLVTKEAPGRQVLAAAARIAVLSVAVSLWWAVALVVEGRYGLSVLRYTETLPSIAQTSSPAEVGRGLGYWYFYGTDRLGSWVAASAEYMTHPGVIAVSFLVPALGFAGALVARFRARSFFVGVTLVGFALSVGVHPYDAPSVVGSALKAVMNGTTTGFALRSTDRATPLVVLGLAALAGAGLSALWARRASVAWASAGLAGAMVLLNAAPLLTGLAVDSHFDRASSLPSYFAAAARYLDSKGDATRVLIEPGENWADYTWGNTIDSVWSGVLSRPSIQRQQLIDGSNQTADLLGAFDLTLQQGTYEPSTLAPIARLLSAGDVVLESDERYWHWGTPEPAATWRLFARPPSGIGAPVMFGVRRANVAPAAYGPLDEEALGVPAGTAPPPPLAVFPVSSARPIDRAEPASAPFVLDGSGAGIVAAAGAGLLDDNPTIIESGSLSGDPALAREALVPGAVLVLTDSNRKELRRWSSVAANIGETLPAVAGPSDPDPTAQGLPLFATSSPASETVATYSDAHYVSASSYGNPIDFTPEDRPAMAFDGDPSTGWLTAIDEPAGGQWLQVALDRPVRTSWLRLTQTYPEDKQRWVTSVSLSFDGGRPVTVSLGPRSREAGGQIVRFPARRFSTLRLTIDSTRSAGGTVAAATGVGFSEVGIPGVTIRETLQLPTDLLTRLGAPSLRHRLVIVLSRDRVGPNPPRSDPEPFMARRFVLPTGRTFALAGTARISPTASDGRVDSLLGGAVAPGGMTVNSNTRLSGDLDARSAMALDGDPDTAWTSGFGSDGQVRGAMVIRLGHTVSFSSMRLQVLADGRHSVPTWLRISTNEHQSELIEVPNIRDGRQAGSIASATLHFSPLAGSIIHVAVVGVRAETEPDWYNGVHRVLPFSIAELGIPGVRLAAPPVSAQVPPVCRDDLMSVDGRPVWLEVTGSVGSAEAGSGLVVRGCGPDARGVHLGVGPHVVVTAPGTRAGIDLDRLVLDSSAGGGASRLLADGSPAPVAGTLGGGGVGRLATPTVRVVHATATSAQLLVNGAHRPFWLVLGESLDAGWAAQVVGGQALGSPTLVDGYANGWYLDPHGRSTLTIDLVWKPQREVNAGLGLSGLAILGCIGLVADPLTLVRRVRRRTAGRPVAAGPHELPTDERPMADQPRLVDLRARTTRRLSARRTLALGALGVVAALLVVPGGWSPVVAACLGGLVVIAGRSGRGRLLGAVALLAMLTTGALVVAGQVRDGYSAGSLWPAHFEAASLFALAAFLALAGDAVLEAVAERSRATRSPSAGRGSRDST